MKIYGRNVDYNGETFNIRIYQGLWERELDAGGILALLDAIDEMKKDFEEKLKEINSI